MIKKKKAKNNQLLKNQRKVIKQRKPKLKLKSQRPIRMKRMEKKERKKEKITPNQALFHWLIFGDLTSSTPIKLPMVMKMMTRSSKMRTIQET